MSHIQSTSVDSGSAAKHAARMKTLKYQDLNATHTFYSIAIETAGSWDDQAVELIEEIGRRSAQETDDPKKTMYLFQMISVAIQEETHWLSPIRLIPTISNNPPQSL